jgi:hypothetical protein
MYDCTDAKLIYATLTFAQGSWAEREERTLAPSLQPLFQQTTCYRVGLVLHDQMFKVKVNNTTITTTAIKRPTTATAIEPRIPSRNTMFTKPFSDFSESA